MNAEELTKIKVLQGIDQEALNSLAAALEEREYENGQPVFAEGDPGDSMYFLAEGRIHIEKRTQAGLSTNKLLAVLEAGDYFGEMALLDQKPRSASALAAGQAKALRLSKNAFDELQNRSSAAGTKMLFSMVRTCSDRIRRLSSHLVVYDEVGKAIGEARSLAGLLNVILQQLSSAVSADWGLLLLRSQFSDELELRGEINVVLSRSQREALSKGQGLLEAVLRNPQDIIVGNFGEHEVFKSCARLGFETTSLLVSPITIEGRLLGLILLGGGQREQFDLDALNLVRGVARQTAQAILNARHREEQEARSLHSRQYVRF